MPYIISASYFFLSLSSGLILSFVPSPSTLSDQQMLITSDTGHVSDFGCQETLWLRHVNVLRRHRQHRNPKRHSKCSRRSTRVRNSTVQPLGDTKNAAVTSTNETDQKTLVSTLTEKPSQTPGKKRGPKPKVKVDHVACPNKTCQAHGKFGDDPQSHIVGNDTYAACGEMRQLYLCQLCKTTFSETKHTAFFGLKTDRKTVCRVLKSLAEGTGIRATARIFEIKPETVLDWLRKAGQHCEQVSAYLIQDLELSQVQLDELWTFVHKKEKRLSAWEKLHSEYGDTWVWMAFDPDNKLVLNLIIGDREEEQAVDLLTRLKGVMVKGTHLLLTSDQLPHYMTGILKVFGTRVQPKRKGDRGRHPKPRLEAPEDVAYATVNKEKKQGRVISVTYKVIFGTLEKIIKCIEASTPGLSINTSFIERMNLTLRHLCSRLKRKGLNFSKKREFLAYHLQLSVAYYHTCRSHRSLRQKLPEPIPTKGNGSPKIWEQRTPFMAAKLTDHIWTMEELLSYRTPPVAAGQA